jgi:hypothetical protein
MDADTEHGAMRDCGGYSEVITVYIHDLVEVCGNAVCEANEQTSASCPSDCHPGAWGRTFLGTNLDTRRDLWWFISPLHAGDRRISAVAPDNTIVMAGVATQSTELDYGGPLVAVVGPQDFYLVLARYSPNGGFLWGRRYPITADHGTTRSLEIGNVTITPDGSIVVLANVYGGHPSQPRVLIGKLAADGQPLWWKSSMADPVPMPNQTLWEPAHLIDHGLAVTPSGDVIIGGHYEWNLRFEGPPANGSAESGSQCSNASDDDGDGVANDGCIVTVPDYVPLSDGGELSAFVAKFSASGLPLWAVRRRSDSNDVAVRDIAADPSGNAIVTLANAELGSIVKLSGVDGTQIWTQPGSYEAVIADAAGDVFASGTYNPQYPYPFTGVELNNFFIVKLAGSDGAVIGLAQSQGVDVDAIGMGIALDELGGPVVRDLRWRAASWRDDRPRRGTVSDVCDTRCICRRVFHGPDVPVGQARPDDPRRDPPRPRDRWRRPYRDEWNVRRLDGDR